MHGATNARLYIKCRGAVQHMSGSILNIIFTYISFNFSIQMAQHKICLALITLSSVLHGTAQPLSGLICIIMEIAHSFSSIHQISCQFIAFLCKDRRPAYLLMWQGTASGTLQFIIKEQCPAPFLSHSHFQGVMSCSTDNCMALRFVTSQCLTLQLNWYRHPVTQSCYLLLCQLYHLDLQ